MQRLLAFQGAFYFLTGIWPVLHMPSFLAVTGGKTDLWLVNTVGLLIAASGLAFLIESRSRRPSRAITLLAMGQALALTGIDVYYVARKVISPVYLLDAVVEVILIALWAGVLARDRSSARRS